MLWKIIINGLLAVCSIIAGVLLVVAADRIVGWKAGGEKLQLATVFSPNADVEYDTLEFKYSVHTNNLGFRGDDTTLRKTRKIRIAAIGDSYTYGWGVNLGDTWVKRLETALREAGHDVEIINLGAPGAGPSQYADRAEELLPLLRPDLVVVGLLQQDDLDQALEAHRQLEEGGRPEAVNPAAPGLALRGLSFRVFPNLSGAVKRERAAFSERVAPEAAARWKSVSGQWKAQAAKFLGGITTEQREYFERTIPERIRRALEEGRLNPSNLNWILPSGPRPNVVPAAETSPTPGIKPLAGLIPAPELHIDAPITRWRIRICAEYLVRIREAAEAAGARVVGLSIPNHNFVRLSGWRRDMYPNAEESVRKDWTDSLTSTAPHEANRQACERAGLPVIEFTQGFRERAETVELFYPYDGHFTVEGNRLFAELLLPRLIPYLE